MVSLFLPFTIVSFTLAFWCEKLSDVRSLIPATKVNNFARGLYQVSNLFLALHFKYFSMKFGGR